MIRGTRSAGRRRRTEALIATSVTPSQRIMDAPPRGTSPGSEKVEDTKTGTAAVFSFDGSVALIGASARASIPTSRIAPAIRRGRPSLHARRRGRRYQAVTDGRRPRPLGQLACLTLHFGTGTLGQSAASGLLPARATTSRVPDHRSSPAPLHVGSAQRPLEIAGDAVNRPRLPGTLLPNYVAEIKDFHRASPTAASRRRPAWKAPRRGGHAGHDRARARARSQWICIGNQASSRARKRRSSKPKERGGARTTTAAPGGDRTQDL